MKAPFNTYLPKLTILLLFLMAFPGCEKDELKSLSAYLDELIDNKEFFDGQKEERIGKRKHLLSIANLSPEQEYEINNSLYLEYEKYNIDSAIYYVERNIEIAAGLKDDSLVLFSNLCLVPLYSFSGMYLEAEDILKSIDPSLLHGELLADYYEGYGRFYRYYATTSSQEKYLPIREAYRDSLLMYSDPSSFRYKANMVNAYLNSGRTDEAEEMLTGMLETEEPDSPNYAMITHSLGRVYEEKGDHSLGKKYYMLSAIADIKNSIKENASFMTLATLYYDDGNISQAFKYTQSAIEDAVFSNIQFRTAEMSKFYSIINASYQLNETQTKAKLKQYLMLISILSLFLILLLLFTYRQMKRLSRIKKELSTVNDRLMELNNELNEKNDLLFESNLIKEQYIAQFFDLCSSYIDKMEDFRKTLNKLALNRQFDELHRKLKSTTIVEQELEELYKNFDNIFLGLYPTFVSDFNSLLVKEEQITLKPGDLMNRELRIYALLRLGITDNAKIASFLRCSLSTVYNYRTKARNKAAISRDGFEDIVMKIGVVHKTDD